jgi:Fe-S-cluster-containing dehydrogenase component
MHCVDPVCMIGCPTGAIHRDESQGEILINDATCIGCSVCANSCPYDNIRMVSIRDPEGRQLLSEASGQPLLEATKCDLCSQQPSGPACVSACAHDALRRVDLNDWSQLASWLPKSGS